jgi:ABC-2 type transport system permease protein
MMIKELFSFEVKNRLKKISTWIYFLFLAFIGFAAIWRGSYGGGLLKKFANAGVDNIHANSPYALYCLITIFSNFFIMVTLAYFSSAATRDFKNNSFQLYYSYPLTKLDYILGRFSGAAFSVGIVFSGIAAGAFLANFIPVTDPEKMGAFKLAYFMQPYLITVLPNILIFGAFFYSFCLLSRNGFASYAALIILLLLYFIGMGWLRVTENYAIASLLDPFGHIAGRSIFDFWTASEKNAMLMPLSGKLLANRLIWLSISFLAMFYTTKKFKFAYITGAKKGRFLPGEAVEEPSEIIRPLALREEAGFGLKNRLFQVFWLAKNDFASFFKNIYFGIIYCCGIVLILFVGFFTVGVVRGIQTYPVTSQILSSLKDTLYMYNMVLILFCATAILWRNRSRNFAEIADSLPVPEWVFGLSGICVLVWVQIFMALTIFFCGMAIQVYYGYYHFEFILYFKELFGISFLYYVSLSIFALFVLTLVNRKILGYIIFILFVDDFMSLIMANFGLEHNLFTFAAKPKYIYSAMNGYGPFTGPLIYYNAYWLFVSGLLAVLLILFWARGKDTTLRNRLKEFRLRFSRRLQALAASACVLSLAAGGFIVYNTCFLNRFASDRYMTERMVSYEKTYKKYESMPQPKITDIRVQVELYPEQRKAEIKGRYILKNKSDSEIREIFVQSPQLIKVLKLLINTENKLKDFSSRHNVHIYSLAKPLLPSSSIELQFAYLFEEKGFKDRDINTKLVKNGTFLHSSFIFPGIGYDPHNILELADNDKRKAYGLAPLVALPAKDDMLAINQNYASRDADWLDYEATIGTAKEQVPLTAGDLLREWEAGGRKYAHFKSSMKLLKYIPVISAKYNVQKDKWRDVEIGVYYQSSHSYNIDKIFQSAKESLQYFSENFSPYPFHHLRIVEFPIYDLYAEAFQGVIPISEGYGFIARYGKKKIPEIYRVNAHEIGHQWWAHQVIGARVEGVYVLSEALAQYSALQVIKKEYPRQKVDEMARDYMHGYFRGRGRETKKEIPLIITNGNTAYNNYDKAFVIMNALQDYMGEDSLNIVLKKFIGKYAFAGPPYPTAYELIGMIKDALPESLKYVVTDLFEKITLYETKIIRADCQPLPGGKYKVRMEYAVAKYRGNENGSRTRIATNDLIAFGIFGENGKVLYDSKHWIRSNRGVV